MKKRLQVNEFVLLIMRVSILQIFLLSGFISISYANDLIAQEILDTKLSVQFEKTNLRAALSKIEKQTGARFLYSSQVIPKEKVSVHSTDETLEQVLDKILLPLGIIYEADGDHIILSRTQAMQTEQMEPAMSNMLIRVSGKVSDATDGLPLPGVNVVAKGTTQGTTTDQDGNYTIGVDDANVVLVFSFIGYAPQEVLVGALTTLNIQLETDISTLEEIVVVGYGQQKKSSLTAAVETIKGEAIANRPVVSISNTLAGRVAGIIATQGNGEPGFDGSTINIRGLGTNGNSGPLLVVDGVYRDFNQLDPASIETFTVLKDAAAVAPYGLAGANGVILVTTKKGKIGAPTLSYGAYVGFQNPTRAIPFVNSVQYAKMRNEAAMNEGKAPAYTDEQIAQYQKTVNGDADADPDLYPNSHGIRDVLEKNAMITYNHLELSGGTDKIRYFTGFGYTTQDGQWKSTKVKKYNLVANVEVEATHTTTVSLKLNGIVTDNKYPGASAEGLMYRAVRIPPTEAIYYSNGLWGQYVGGSLVGQMYHGGYQKNEETKIYSSLAIEQKLPFLDGLSVKGQASYDPNFTFNKNWYTPIPVYTLNTSTTPFTYDKGFQGPSKSNLEEKFSQSKAMTYQGFLNYAHVFGNHDISVLGVIESRHVRKNDFNSLIINYNSTIDELSTGSADKLDYTIGGSAGTERQIGYVYRVSYAYAGKYMAEVAGRYDGHYQFAPGNRYSFFPAYSIGWNIGEESFIKDNLRMVDLLKIRGSYGKSGNLPKDANFEYLSSYELYGGSYNFGGTPNQGLKEVHPGNPDITWEKSTKYDVGLEASLWNGLLTVQADVFKEHRTGMLVSPQNLVPAEYGVGLAQANAGIMDNHGFELSLGTSHTFSNGIRLNVTGNMTYVKNNLVQILENNLIIGDTRRTGRPLNTQFGYEALGYFSENDFNLDGSLKEGVPVPVFGAVRPGDLKYADLSGPNGTPDGIIDPNDQTVIGKPKVPQLMFGLMPNIAYKGFDLDLLFQGAAQNSMYIQGNMAAPFDGASSATTLQYDNHWTPANVDALYPRLTLAPTGNNTQGSSWWIRDGRYVRLKTAQLGYTFLPNLIARMKVVKSLRLYVAAQNLFTYTPKLKEIIDPEVGDKGNGQYYYQQRVVSVGINVSF